MPCTDGGVPYPEPEANSKVNKLTDMLCRILKAHENDDNLDWIDSDIQHWWQLHKKNDIEKQKKENERLKKEALRKLTAEEKKALGLL